MNRPTHPDIAPDAVIDTREQTDRTGDTVNSMTAVTHIGVIRHIGEAVTDPRLAMQERRADKEERHKYGED